VPRDLIPSEIRDFTEENRVSTDVIEVTEDYLKQSREMILLREQKARLEAREAELKKELLAVLEAMGEPYGPEGQHRTIAFPRPIRNIARFVRQTKSTTKVDLIKAEAIARSKGIHDRLFTMQPTLDQDAVMVAVEEGLITDEELADIFPRTTTYAFVVEKAKK